MAGQSYTLALHFAELYFDAAGGRVFTVLVNGAAVLADFDIFAEAGALWDKGRRTESHNMNFLKAM